jgi:hypothetical protein
VQQQHWLWVGWQSCWQQMQYSGKQQLRGLHQPELL